MNVDEVLEKLQPWRAQHARRAWMPMTVDEDGSRVTSKFSGVPWIGTNEPWPSCCGCHSLMPFFLQLNISELPEPARAGLGSGLIQLFYCIDCDGGWEPFSEVSLVRMVPEALLSEAKMQLDREPEFPARRIEAWEEIVDYPHPEEHEDLGLSYDYDFHAKPTRIRIECQDPAFVADGITDVELAEKISLSEAGDKLGGWPNWIQSVEYPLCPLCKQKMRFVFQVDSECNLPFMFGDLGTGHITQCPTHVDTLAFGWACS